MDICNHNFCTGCGVCKSVCKFDSISFHEDAEGFVYPVVDANKCRKCGTCIRTCPMNRESFNTKPADFYMAWHKDKDVLMHSSSGGVFTALSQYVFRLKGCVFGAAVDFDTHEVYHMMIETEEDLQKLRYSKYYQSNVGNSYEEVRKQLEEDRWVLFSGTACQIAALYQYLGSNQNEKLITMDVLCHGVTSKKIFEKYLESKEKKYDNKVAAYSFRVKNDSIWWSKGSTMMMMMMDGSVVYENLKTDTFFTAFNNNIILRESCYRCKFCGTNRISDFTGADFWGIKPEMVDTDQLKTGVSIFLVNSDKAKALLPALINDLEITPIDSALPISHNRALVQPNDRPINRDKFFETIENHDFDRTVKYFYKKKYLKQGFKSGIIKVIGEEQLNNVKKIVKGK